jgi:predicted lipoprotein with Yx(FWY)xxD motif
VRSKILALCFAAGLVLAACGSDDGSSSTPSTTSGSGGASQTTGGAAASGDVTVAVATLPELGDHLVDAKGRTLYIFEKDQGTTTACTGPCVAVWPPVVAADPVAGDGVEQDELSTATGIEANQVTYHGHLLYYFATDTAPGDINGTKIASWYAVSPDGEEIELGARTSSGY